MTRDALLLELEATRRTLEEREAELARERAEVERLKAENAQLQHRIDVLARRMFGRSSERLTPGQYLLAFEAAKAEAERAREEDARETALGEETERTPRPRRVKPSEKPRQQALAVRRLEVEPEASQLHCGCGATKERIGEETSERLEYVPASLFVLQTVRGKYACRGCEGGVVIAPLPPQGHWSQAPMFTSFGVRRRAACAPELAAARAQAGPAPGDSGPAARATPLPRPPARARSVVRRGGRDRIGKRREGSAHGRIAGVLAGTRIARPAPQDARAGPRAAKPLVTRAWLRTMARAIRARSRHA